MSHREFVHHIWVLIGKVSNNELGIEQPRNYRVSDDAWCLVMVSSQYTVSSWLKCGLDELMQNAIGAPTQRTVWLSDGADYKANLVIHEDTAFGVS